MLNSSRDDNESVQTPSWGGGRSARYVIPDEKITKGRELDE